jgi:hypothetical protein
MERLQMAAKFHTSARLINRRTLYFYMFCSKLHSQKPPTFCHRTSNRPDLCHVNSVTPKLYRQLLEGKVTFHEYLCLQIQ